MHQIVTTYADLAKYAAAFAEGYFNLFVLLGDPGLAKSTSVRKATENIKSKWFEGTMSAFRLYIESYHHRGKPLIIDDVDSLYSDKAAVRILKSLCQTELEKTIMWQTNAAALDNEGVPREFLTNSKVCIIANEWHSINENVAAINDRGIVVDFKPTSSEVHRKVGEWKTFDKAVYNFIGKNLELVLKPSMRLYINTQDMKKADLPWKDAFFNSIAVSPELQVILKLRDDEQYTTEEARVNEFRKQTSYSRAAYFKLKATLPRQVTE